MTEPWYEEDDLWVRFRDALFPESRWAGTAAEIDEVLALSETQSGTVLDLCCGPGRHSLELARRGFDVTGVDRTEVYLEEARRRASDESLSVEWVQSDMRTFVRDARFDLALSMYTSFGYFSEEEDQAILEHIFASLRPGGSLVLETMGLEVLAKIFVPKEWSRLDDGRIWFQEREIEPGWRYARTKWTLIDDRARHEWGFRLRIYSGHELANRLERVGFTDVRLFGDLSGAPYAHGATRLVAVATRPEGGEDSLEPRLVD